MNKALGFLFLIVILQAKSYSLGQTISAGGGHTIVACSPWSAQGQAMVWGNNLYGQLGNGSTVSIATVPTYANITNVECVSAGWSHCTAVKKDGTLWTWGYNTSGQLGQASAAFSISQPTQVLGMNGVRSVACGYEHTIVLKQNGTVWTCGINGQGQLGNGTNNPSGTFMQVAGLSNIIQVAGGYTHSMALKDDGSVWVWGNNGFGQLGTGALASYNSPQQNLYLTNVVYIAAAGSHSLAVKSDGTVWAWGKNNFGQLGLGNITNQNTPQQIISISGVIAAAAGWEHSVILKSDSTIWTFGRNTEGQLGTGNFTASNTPVVCPLPVGVKEIAAGTYHNMAIGNDNVLRMWGNNYDGHCGIGTSQNYISSPVPTISVCDLASGILSVEEKDEVIVYPNPVSRVLNILSASGGNYSVYDMFGHCISKGRVDIESRSLDLGALTEGVYHFVFSTELGITVKRLVISR